MRNILFFDFDDTLYSHRAKCVSPAVQAALSRLHCHQQMLVVASGRGRESEQFIRDALGFIPDYLILMNGQLILQGEELVYENFAEAAPMKEMMDLAEQFGYPCGGYYADGILVNEMTIRVEAVWQDFQATPPVVIPHFQNRYSLYQGHLYITKDETASFLDCMQNYVINWSHPYLVNLIPKSAGKSQAIRWLLDTLKIDRDRAYAFGDGFNDLDMLQAVGHGVAMGNGSDRLKAVAQYITSPVDGRGVLDALEHYSLI